MPLGSLASGEGDSKSLSFKPPVCGTLSRPPQTLICCRSVAQSCPALCDPMDCSTVASLSLSSWSSPQSMFTASVMLSRHSHVCLAAQSCPALCDPVDRSPPGASVHGILQARVLE